jgi:hypothetical protein
MSATVTVRCVACGATREIGAGEVPAGESPMCESCFSPMVVESATAEEAGNAG